VRNSTYHTHDNSTLLPLVVVPLRTLSLNIFFCLVSHERKLFIIQFLVHCILNDLEDRRLSPQNIIHLTDFLIPGLVIFKLFLSDDWGNSLWLFDFICFQLQHSILSDQFEYLSLVFIINLLFQSLEITVWESVA
jgi:hypothetical protein